MKTTLSSSSEPSAATPLINEHIDGLSSAEVERLIRAEGYNELPGERRKNLLGIIVSSLREPMLLLLIGIAVTYFLIGDPNEALLLCAGVGVIIVLTILQESKTTRVLEALRDLASPRALVIREGKPVRVPGREVVRGDALVVSEGDRVPADAVLISGAGVAVDESLLTGESASVSKVPGTSDVAMEAPGNEQTPYLYAGTLVVRGHGTAVVKRTGPFSELGRIGKTIEAPANQQTHLQRGANTLVRALGIGGIGLSVVVVLVYGLVHGPWLQGILAGLSMAVSIVPEEVPVVLTIFFAIGAWRIAQKNVLARRVAAVEALGAATVLCVDKTGTLTQNQMEVEAVVESGRFHDLRQDGELSKSARRTLEIAALASQTHPFDPMEKAVLKVTPAPEHEIVKHYPLEPTLLAMTNVVHLKDQKELTVAAKGAPESVADLCDLSPRERDELMRHVNELGQRGMRVLAVGVSSCNREGPFPSTPLGYEFELLGLIGFSDPIRTSVPAAIAHCHEAGIRVVMITGDSLQTALSIAKQVGISGNVITGKELHNLSDNEIAKVAATHDVFARILPEQKLRLVRALRQHGGVVAMTGDGVNDAPALRAADIGIAMGKRGTDVAREAADLVLLDDEFSSIVHAIGLGRRTYENVKHALSYILAVHVPIVGLTTIPLLLGWPLIMLPIHIVYLELIIDPACAMVFESQPETFNLMKRGPRPKKASLFTRRELILKLLEGASVLIACLGVFWFSLTLTKNPALARALAYTTLIIANLGMITAGMADARSLWATVKGSTIHLKALLAICIGSLGAILYVPWLRDRFSFAPLRWTDFAVSALIALISVGWVQLLQRSRLLRLRRE